MGRNSLSRSKSIYIAGKLMIFEFILSADGNKVAVDKDGIFFKMSFSFV